MERVFQCFANYLISSTYPTMMELSSGMTYGFYGGRHFSRVRVEDSTLDQR
ncbi:MAG: hypothetical protein WC914_03890 [Proteiniphilum sp.]|jgi:hypothetical protein